MRWGEESPSHGFAVPAPFRQGGWGGGGTDCHTSVRTGFAMTGFLQGVRYGIDGRTEASAPTERVECLRRAGDRKGRPYGSVTRGAVKRAVGDAGPYAPYETSIGRDDVGIVPYGCVAGSAVRWVTARVAPTEKGSP